jgi:glycosyltransferase involved in cell wall biosynthesis
MQHAGYLYLDASLNNAHRYKLTVTNWGSDIFFFQNEKFHKIKIMKLLQIADQYSAECDRDYALAKNLGFNGVNLPVIPNAGGFSAEVMSRQTLPVEQKKKIYIKGYGGKFGLGAVAIEVGIKLLNEFTWIELNIVSVSPELEKIAKELTIKYPNRVKYWSIKSKLKHDEVLNLLGESIIYIGASKSDGISTTFLESLVAGAYPIQTETSCASEWTKKGFHASVVPPNFESVYNAAKHALSNLKETEKLVIMNKELSAVHLSSKSISQIALKFYD